MGPFPLRALQVAVNGGVEPEEELLRVRGDPLAHAASAVLTKPLHLSPNVWWSGQRRLAYPGHVTAAVTPAGPLSRGGAAPVPSPLRGAEEHHHDR